MFKHQNLISNILIQDQEKLKLDFFLIQNLLNSKLLETSSTLKT